MRNMRQVFCIVGVSIIAALLIGACGAGVKKSMVPKWYLNPPESKTKIYGVGASEKTQSIQLGKTTADANARTDLAVTIQVSVQSMVRTFLQQSGTMETSKALQFSESVSKQVVDVKLTGVRIARSEIVNGRYFSLAEVSMDSMKNALLSAVRDAAAQFSEEKAKEAFKDLEKEIDKGNIPIIKE